MARRSDASLAALLLVQRLVDVDAEPLKAAQFWSVLDRAPDPGALLPLNATEIAERLEGDHGLGRRVRALLDAATALAIALESSEQSGVHAVSPLDDRYPAALTDRLGRSAPPVLYAAGDLDLLNREALGIVGSRAVDDDGADIAGAAARAAVAHGWGVVSGGAKGVDRLAMQAAIDAGGSVAGVLADSLTTTVKDADVRRAITDGSLCLVTPYKPTAGFSVASAMGRNKLIYALSTGTLVVASDLDKGGTWAGAVEALKQRIAPVLVWRGDGGGDGNARLVELGAAAVTEVDDIVPTIGQQPPRPSQLPLGL